MKSIIRIALILLLITNHQLLITLNAQISINEDGSSPDASAILDVTSTSKGILIPRMDSTSRNNISNPATGLMVFDSTTNSFWYYANSDWNNINRTFLEDSDGNTKIQVEESSDEDIIRFDLGGTEFLRLDSGRIQVANTGYSIFLGNNTGSNDDFTNNANVFIGNGAGKYNTSGYYNVALGNQSSADNITGYANVSLGYGAGHTNAGHENIFLGYQAGYNETGSNKLYIENSDTTSPLIYGEFDNNWLQINGNLSATNGFTDDDNDTKIQVEESTDEDIIRFDLGGTEFMRLNNGRIEVLNTGRSIFIGEDAGLNDDLSDNDNIFIGYQAGKSSTSGAENIMMGYEAGKRNTTGDYNVFLGTGSGSDNTSGGDNTFIGYEAGYNNTTGSNNVFLGDQAGHDNETGSNNVFIGYEAGYYATSSDKLYIENSDATSPLIYGEFDNDRIVINGNSTDNSNNRTLFVNGSIGATSAFNNDSDRRLKTNIQTIPNALNKILEMRGVTYQWKDGREKGNRMGFIAQEVEPILPQVVDNQNDHYTMQYAPITAVLVEAVKELKAENDELKQQISKVNQLEQQNAEMKAMLEQIQAQLNIPNQ